MFVSKILQVIVHVSAGHAVRLLLNLEPLAGGYCWRVRKYQTSKA